MNFKLILGTDCNLNCKYCYQKHCKNEMSYEVIDKFLERFNALPGVHHINFFGGEPFLYMEKMLYILKRIDQKHDVSVTTNGTFRKEFYELEKAWGKPIWNLLSNKEHGNYHKLNEFSSFRWLVSHESLKELTDETVRFLAKEYGRNLDFKYILTEKWTEEDVERMEAIQKIIQGIIAPDFFIDLPVNANVKYTCLARNMNCFINWNGNYLSCHRCPQSIIGNIFTGDFQYANNALCIDENNLKVENLYSYGNYKFKGFSLFCGCDH